MRFLLILTASFPMFTPAGVFAQEKPNILWLVQEDTSPWMGCYGYAVNKGHTPVVDKLAADGVIFKRAYVPAPVCSPCRSSFIVGAFAFRFGAHEHRSHRGKAAKPLPEGMKAIPELMLEAGYTTFNIGKTDYNFSHGDFYPRASTAAKGNGGKKGKKAKGTKGFMTAPWRRLPKGKPFFGQIQLKGGKTKPRNLSDNEKTDPANVTVPADYPQNDLYRRVVAKHCDTIRSEDKVIGAILAALKEDGLEETTIVVYFSDHGANNLVRHKQQPTEAGLHVPFMIRGPEKWVPKKGQVRNDLVSILDLSATTLTWAGIEYPKWIEGQNLFAKDFKPREFVGSGRDRCDHTIDRIRTVRTERYRYTRNYLLDRVLLHPQYRDGRDFLKSLRAAYAKGTLAPKLAEIYFGERPPEELYDMENDPAQVNNLVGSKDHQEILEKHREILDQWVAKGDMGEGTEPDIELEMNGNGRFKGVNPEYERVRTDSDGDGLSDRWERYNGRNPEDGKLQFEFDCGGWQTEGWHSGGNLTNIPGRQGFLDFDMLAESASISRKGLKLDASKNKGKLAIRMRATAKTELTVAANGKEIGKAVCAGNNEFAAATVPLGASWSGTIESLTISLAAPKGTTVEVDWIRVE